MATSYDIADRLIELGDEVPDKDLFVRKMSDPKFAEEVRLQLKGYDDEVPDSSTFHNKYGNIKPSTYQFQPFQREGLLNAIREVGYSGLTDEQKALYKQQYDASDYAKAGHSFEDAVRISDEKANQNQPSLLEKAQDIYKEVRGGIGHITSIPVSYIDALQTTKSGVGSDGKEIAVPRWSDNPSYIKRVGRSAEELQKQAKEGEGLMGVVSDPAIVAQVGLGLGTLGSSIPAQTLIGGVGGGISHLMNTKDPTITGTALSTGLGAGLGLVGSGFGAPQRRLAEKVGDISVIESKIAPYNERIPAVEAQLSDLLQKQAASGDLKIPSELGLSTFQKGIRAGKELDVADLASQIAQLEELVKANQFSGIKQQQLLQLKEQKQALMSELLERQNRPLFPSLNEIANRKFMYSSPAISSVVDKTGIGKVVDYVKSIPGEKTFKLTTGLGNTLSTGADRKLDRLGTRISEEIEKDPLTKGLVKRIEKR